MAVLVSVLIGPLLSPHLRHCCADEFTEQVVPSTDPEIVASNTTFVWPRTWNLGGDVTFRLRGRIDTDAIWSHQSAANEATFGDLGDVVGLRRARIGAEGALGSNARYLVEVDLPDGQVIPRDIYAAYGDRQVSGEVQAGHFREPFSLEGGTSVRTFPFMERSPVNMLDPARNWGLGLFRESRNEQTAWAFGAFHAGSDVGGLQGGDGDTVGFTSRLTHAPINEGNGERLVHFGLALSERVPENGFIIINQQPNNPLLDQGDSSTSPFVPTIRIPASYEQLINLQFAAARGSWWTQAEWYGAFIDQTGGDSVFFHGFHVDCGYFLTGEHREYDSTNGVLGAVRVNRPFLRCCADGDRPHGWGAWELTSRFDYLDFFDRDTPVGPDGQLVGIRLPEGTLGVNWYLSDRVRLMFNYSYEAPNEMNTGVSTASIYATRLEVFW
jgi:phosphate-selective porin OprO and OprP